MGGVYRARDTTLDRDVAVKLALPIRFAVRFPKRPINAAVLAGRVARDLRHPRWR
jgi:hypothetical protein